MALFVRDTFTDTDNTLLENHTGETGATWTKHTATATGSAQISNANRAHSTTAAAAIYTASGTPPTASYLVEGTIRMITDPNDVAGVVGRFASTTVANGYIAYGSAGNEYRLSRLDLGAETNLGIFAQAYSVGVDAKIGLDNKNTAKRLLVNDIEGVTSADNTYTAAGLAGLIWNLVVGSDTVGTHIDNFVATDAASASSVGRATSTATGSSSAAVPATSRGVATALARSSSTATAVINAVGSSTAIAVGASLSQAEGAMSSNGIATAIATGSSSNTSILVSSGVATGIGTGSSSASGVANAAAAATAQAVGAAVVLGDGAMSAVGQSTAQSASSAVVTSAFSSTARATAVAVGADANAVIKKFGPRGRKIAEKQRKKQLDLELTTIVEQDEADMIVIQAAFRMAVHEYLKMAA